MLRFQFYLLALLGISITVLVESEISLAQSPDTPTILDSRIKSVELFAELQNAIGFDAVINDGVNGFPRGLLLTSGPGRRLSRSIYHVSETGGINKFVDGLEASEGIVFGLGGNFGTDLFVAESRFPRIIKVDSSGNVSSFSTDFTAPFGPAGIAFGPGGDYGTNLYAADLSGRRIVTIDPSGNVSTFFPGHKAVPKAVAFDLEGWYGKKLYTASFTAVPFEGPPGQDAIFSLDANGNISTFATGLTGAEMITFDDRGVLGSGMFIATVGWTDIDKDGSLSFVDMHGNVKPVLGSIDATKIVFDNDNLLGGGAFVIESINTNNVLRIWHITPSDDIPSSKVSEPTSTISLLALGTLGAASTLKRKLKSSKSTGKETTKVG